MFGFTRLASYDYFAHVEDPGVVAELHRRTLDAIRGGATADIDQVMDEHLNKGQYKSIPTVIFLDGEFNELGVWIERPDSVIRLGSGTFSWRHTSCTEYTTSATYSRRL